MSLVWWHIMTSRKSHKQRGARFEVEVKDYFRSRGYSAERLARAGRNDEGDVVVHEDFLGQIGILEAKAPGQSGRIDLSGWSKEAKTEAGNYAKARDLQPNEILPAVVIKARGKAIADSYIVFRLGDLFDE
jgi:hypothetical protein